MVGIDDVKAYGVQAAALLRPDWRKLVIALTGFVLTTVPLLYALQLTYIGTPLPVAAVRDGACKCTILLRCGCSTAMKAIYEPVNAVADALFWYLVGVFAVVGYGRWNA